MTESPDIVGLIGEHVSQMTLGQAKEVEERILAGENEIEVPYLLGTGPDDPRKLKYTIPKWRRAPRDRLRIEIARREHRGLSPFPRFMDPILWFIAALFALALADNLGWLSHLLVISLACAGAFGVVLFTRWSVERRNVGPFTRIAELEKEIEAERLKAADALVGLQKAVRAGEAMATALLESEHVEDYWLAHEWLAARKVCRICRGPLEGAPGPECDSTGCPSRDGTDA